MHAGLLMIPDYFDAMKFCVCMVLIPHILQTYNTDCMKTLGNYDCKVYSFKLACLKTKNSPHYIPIVH